MKVAKSTYINVSNTSYSRQLNRDSTVVFYLEKYLRVGRFKLQENVDKMCALIFTRK